MKVAEVNYTGRVNHQRHRGPSGIMYRFEGTSVGVESMADAESFQDKPNYEVEFTARGRLLAMIRDDAQDLSEAIGEIEYNAKRSIAGALDVEAESQEETAIEEALVDVAEDLQNQMENQ